MRVCGPSGEHNYDHGKTRREVHEATLATGAVDGHVPGIGPPSPALEDTHEGTDPTPGDGTR